MTLHPIEYNEGILWVDKSNPIFRQPDPLRYAIICDRDFTKIVLVSDLRGVFNDPKLIAFEVKAQSPNLPLPNIPYIEIEDSAKKYTEEDLRRAYQTGEGRGRSSKTGVQPYLSEEEFIQSLNPKPVSVEIEMKAIDGCNCKFLGYKVEDSACSERNRCIEPVTYTKDGKTFLKVKKINYE